MLQIRNFITTTKQSWALLHWQRLHLLNVRLASTKGKSSVKKHKRNFDQQENDLVNEDFTKLSETYSSPESPDIIPHYEADIPYYENKALLEETKGEHNEVEMVEFCKRYEGDQSLSVVEDENVGYRITPSSEVLKLLQEEHLKKHIMKSEDVSHPVKNLKGDQTKVKKSNSKILKEASKAKKREPNDFLQSRKKIVILKGKRNESIEKFNINNKPNSFADNVKKVVLSDRGKEYLQVSNKLERIVRKEESLTEKINDSAIASSQYFMKKNSPLFRDSKLGIQMLSLPLYNQLFSNVPPKENTEMEQDLARSKEHLIAQGLWGKEPSVIPDFDLQLPLLKDKELDSHFRLIAEEQCSPYKELLNCLVGANIPNFPTEWQYRPGWTKYNPDGSWTAVDAPDCRALIFDVEVCVTEGKQPTLATAVSDNCWYSWCSHYLVCNNLSSSGEEVQLSDLIPLESTNDSGGPYEAPRIVVGHNVSYDRLRVCEQYSIEGTALRFVDTMSLHIAVSGLISEQRALLLKNKNADTKVKLPWMFVGCANNLSDVFKFYCKSDKGLEKDVRNVFVKGDINDVRNDFQNLMNYCATDVKATHMVLERLLPLFFERFPHPVTFAGMLEMGTTFLPVTENWNKYIRSAESEFHETERLLNEELVKQARGALGYMKNQEYQNDPWIWSLDWSVPKGRVKKLPGYPNWYRKLCARTGEREGTPEPENMSTSLQIVPKLLRLTWNGLPLHFERKYGWGYLKPKYETVESISQTEIDDAVKADPSNVFPVKALYEMQAGKRIDLKQFLGKIEGKTTDLEDTDDWLLEVSDQSESSKRTNKSKTTEDEEEKSFDIGIPGVKFVPLPHKDGPGNRVGNPLAKDFLHKIEDKTLSSYVGNIAELVLKTTKSLSYWRNNRDRILNQMVIWNEEKCVDEKEGSRVGIILPMVVTAGTITRRAVEPTWMTASNAYVDRIGSELKAMVEAPPGYKFVGADVDSQELWIAAVLGDAYFSGEHGATALGWMTLQGKKSDGSDMHSRTAHTAGISRDHAKVINYGRIYGAGLRFIQRLLRQFNPKLSDRESQERATHLFATTKGRKGWTLNESGEKLAAELKYPVSLEALDRKEINKLLRQARQNNIDVTFQDIVDGPAVWVGGSESHMFNCLEAIARSEAPRTPVLGARITRTLEPQYVDDQYMTSRVNWVVQSSAVDYLHIMLVSMKWLLQEYKISGRFCISIHDEVRYLVASEDAHRAALALQITNLLTRSLFAQRLGLKDLPQSVAFFSAVDVDDVLRKEPHLDCVTPSNPGGMTKHYGIAPGEAMDMKQILEMTKGDLSMDR